MQSPPTRYVPGKDDGMQGIWLRERAAVAGFGHSRYGKRGEFAARGTYPLVIEAIKNACEDAGISPSDIDGFSTYAADQADHGELASALGAHHFRFSAQGPTNAGGGGMGGAYLYAAMAVATGQANYVAVARGLTQPPNARFGGMGASNYMAVTLGLTRPPNGSNPSPNAMPRRYPMLASPAQSFALQARRHMHEFGTTIDHFGEVAINARLNAAKNPDARMRQAITMEEHHASRMIADPLRLLDCCLESDGGACVIITSAKRARDLRHPLVLIAGAAMGAPRRWGAGMLAGHNMSAEDFTSAGQNSIATDLYYNSGIDPTDVDVALIYDHFTPMVLMALEDFQFVKKGDSGPFVADGNIRVVGGSLPVNPHGGHLAEVYLHGMTHVFEGVRQLRGSSSNQVSGAETALVVAGAAPTSGAFLLRKG